MTLPSNYEAAVHAMSREVRHYPGAVVTWRYARNVSVIAGIDQAQVLELYTANEEGEAMIRAMRKVCIEYSRGEPTINMVRVALQHGRERQ